MLPPPSVHCHTELRNVHNTGTIPFIIVIAGVHPTHLEGKLNQVLPLQGSMSAGESNDFCLLHQQIVHPITTASKQLKCPELLHKEEEDEVWMKGLLLAHCPSTNNELLITEIITGV